MRLPMSYTDLEYFIVVAEEENLRSASDLLGIAQPALSRRIQKLEDSLGVKLFDRRKQRIVLSRVGREFLGMAHSLVKAGHRAVEKTKRFARGEEGFLAIGVSEFAIRDPRIKEILRSFAKANPGVAIDYQPMNSVSLRGRIESDDLDFAFTTTLSTVALPASCLCLSEHDMMVAAPEGFWPKDKSIRMADLHEREIIWFHPDAALDFTNAVKDVFHKGGVSLVLKPSGLTEPGRLNFVAAGMGISIISSLSALANADADLLRPIEDFDARMQIIGIWNEQNDNPALARLLALIRAMPDEAADRRTAAWD